MYSENKGRGLNISSKHEGQWYTHGVPGIRSVGVKSADYY